MTNNVINLRDVRKRKEREKREAVASANRAKYGRTKVQRTHQEADANRRQRDLDGARIEPMRERDDG